MWLLLTQARCALKRRRVPLTKLPFAYADTMENTPIVFGQRPLLVANFRDDTKSNQDGYKAEHVSLHP